MAIKIFKLNDYDWWAGEDLESVAAAYRGEVADAEIKNPYEVSDLDAQKIRFVEGDDPIPPDDWTFAQQLAHMIKIGYEFPCAFASTEW